MSTTQSAANHAKMVPLYHYVTFLLVAVPTLYFIKTTITAFSVANLMFALFGAGVVLATFYARVFPLGVQDRVIRLEERLRLERVLPNEMRGKIEEISTEHLIGLRYASDEELAELAGRVLGGELADRKAIKAAVRQWRADHQRI